LPGSSCQQTWPEQPLVGSRKADIAILSLAVLWLGLLLGVSFLATPVKFWAPSLTLSVALDVGRQTFAAFNRAEWLLIALLLALFIVGRRTPVTVTSLAIAAAVTIAQALWLLPVLDARVGIILAGGQPPPSALHDIYLAAELIKLLALSVLSLNMARRLAGGGRTDAPAAEATAHEPSPSVQETATLQTAVSAKIRTGLHPDRVLNSIDRNRTCG
jgi:hypothetical protein